jgi:hypothetical protein
MIGAKKEKPVRLKTINAKPRRFAEQLEHAAAVIGQHPAAFKEADACMETFPKDRKREDAMERTNMGTAQRFHASAMEAETAFIMTATPTPLVRLEKSAQPMTLGATNPPNTKHAKLGHVVAALDRMDANTILLSMPDSKMPGFVTTTRTRETAAPFLAFAMESEPASKDQNH